MDNDLKLIEENIKLFHNLSLESDDKFYGFGEETDKSFASFVDHKFSGLNGFASGVDVVGKSSGSERYSFDSLERKNFQLESVLDENLILKKAINKLRERIQGFDSVEKQNNELRLLMHKAETENYLIRIQLQNILEGQKEIEKEKEVF